jgi:hypothetical protein
MPKRFTDTAKWDDPWFRELPPGMKCFWQYLCDRCDPAGVWVVDLKGAAFAIGEPLDAVKVWATFAERLEKVSSDNGERWRIVKFVQFQYPTLSRDCKPHNGVFIALEKHGLDEVVVKNGFRHPKVTQTQPKGSLNLQDKEKETDKENEAVKDAEKEHGKCPLQLRAEKLFNRRVSTPWTKGELTAWKTAKAILADATEQEWADLAAWFTLPAERAAYRRNGFAALLNNWQDEIIRARRPENLAAISAATDALAESEAAARRNSF